MIHKEPPMIRTMTSNVNRKVMMFHRGFDSIPKCMKKTSWISAEATADKTIVTERSPSDR